MDPPSPVFTGYERFYINLQDLRAITNAHWTRNDPRIKFKQRKMRAKVFRKERKMNPDESLQKGDGLLLVDVQKDFCPGGALPIQEGDKVVPVLNRWIEAAGGKNIPVYASRDWHPERHISFRGHGGPWPPHCLQDSLGAGFHPDLKLPGSTVKVTKGTRFDHDQNSAFDETGLADQLKRDGVNRLWVGGLALDVCVLASVLDALKAGLEVVLIEEGTRAVDPEEGNKALEKMRKGGAKIF
jgi:nicotinamidase/pyrazinamidase